jgi:hypothetical protein
LLWQEKHRGQAQLTEAAAGGSAEGDDGAKPTADAPKDTSGSADENAGQEQDTQENNGEEGAEGDVAPTVGSLTYVMFRSDRHSKHARKEQGSRGVPAVEWASLNDEAKASIVELVNDRREAIERIVHGMRWP